MTPGQLLGARVEDGRTLFALGDHLHGARGGPFGGALAACCLQSARASAPGRQPLSLDCRFLRTMPAGDAEARALPVAQDPSLTTVQVAITGADATVAAVATVSLVQAGMLAPVETDESLDAPAGSYADAVPWAAAGPARVPLLETLAPRSLTRGGRAITTAIRLPWTPDPATAAEAACLVADLCVGPPMASVLEPARQQHTNLDLSLRFCGTDLGGEVYGTGRLVRTHGGVGAVEIAVFSQRRLIAVGAAGVLMFRAQTQN